MLKQASCTVFRAHYDVEAGQHIKLLHIKLLHCCYPVHTMHCISGQLHCTMLKQVGCMSVALQYYVEAGRENSYLGLIFVCSTLSKISSGPVALHYQLHYTMLKATRTNHAFPTNYTLNASNTSNKRYASNYTLQQILYMCFHTYMYMLPNTFQQTTCFQQNVQQCQ